MNKEFSIPMVDLSRLCVECGYCQTMIVLNLEGQLDVTHCPACHRDFDPGLKENIAAIARAYVWLKTSKHKLSFRVPAQA